MRLLVALEQRFLSDERGVIHSPGGRGVGFWQHYLDVFEEVVVLARVAEAEIIPPEYEVASSKRVRFHALPMYIGPWQYLLHHREIQRRTRQAADQVEAIMIRAPGTIASGLARLARRAHRPYGVEVVGDPWDVFRPGTNLSILSPFLRRLFAARLRDECRHAVAVSYVTCETLQRCYPAAPGAFATYYSGVEIGNEAFVEAPREFVGGARRLISVGTFAADYKGFDVLLGALARFTPAMRPQLAIVGTGRLLSKYKQTARSLGIADSVTFTGRLKAGEAVRCELDRADLFVLASRTEGLPRALIEAMARGLPCLGTRVGGIPELLPPEHLVPAGDADALFQAISALLAAPDLLTEASSRNLQAARDYHTSILARRRRQMYEELERRTRCRN